MDYVGYGYIDGEPVHSYGVLIESTNYHRAMIHLSIHFSTLGIEPDLLCVFECNA